MKQIGSLIFLIWTSFYVNAQELNCQVSIVTNAKMVINTTDLEVLDQLEEAMRQFMNETKWTKDNFTIEERIQCQIQFQVNSVLQPGVFQGMLQVQSSRPVYDATYNTLMLNIPDKEVTIAFSRNAMLNYSPNQYRDNLTSILAFYAYYIIGMDYDSFGKKEGDKYLQEAQSIVVAAQVSGDNGWASNQDAGRRDNRYWLMDNALNQLFEPLRDCVYEYHREGLDRLVENPQEARKTIYEALNKLTQIVSVRPNTPNIVLFLQAKFPELKQIFATAQPTEKTNLVRTLKRLDPTNSPKYDEILK